MTADGQDPDDGEGQPDQEEERVLIRLPELFVLYEPFLRRLRVTDKVASAIEELHSLKPKSWNSDEQVRIRLACVRILEEYAEALEGESGELPMETAALYQRTRDSLAFLRDTLEGERRALADFSQDLEESGYATASTTWSNAPGKAIVSRARSISPPRFLRMKRRMRIRPGLGFHRASSCGLMARRMSGRPRC